MANKEDLALIAHLLRRAGFGATQEELERYAAQGYEATVEELINPPADQAAGKTALLIRYNPSCLLPGGITLPGQYNWMYHMITTQRPLEEKIALFWHQVFATANSKLDGADQLVEQIVLFRKIGMDSYRDILLEVAKDPTMIFWLDNNENHRYAVNENWGRELLELFSMGVSNYTEVDVREASRAFTGWNIEPRLPRQPYWRFPWKFEYRAADHDEGEKTFLGRTGNFNGEDIINIILEEPATARFMCRHLYNFFVADDVQVPAWTSPRRPFPMWRRRCWAFENGRRCIVKPLRIVFIAVAAVWPSGGVSASSCSPARPPCRRRMARRSRSRSTPTATFA